MTVTTWTQTPTLQAVVSAGASSGGYMANGSAAVVHPTHMTREQLAELAQVVADLLSPLPSSPRPASGTVLDDGSRWPGTTTRGDNS